MVDSVKSDDVLIKKIALNRNRIALMTGEVAYYRLDSMGLSDRFGRGKYRWDAPLYIAFSKKHSDARKYMELSDKDMEIIKNNGVYEKVLADYPFLAK